MKLLASPLHMLSFHGERVHDSSSAIRLSRQHGTCRHAPAMLGRESFSRCAFRRLCDFGQGALEQAGCHSQSQMLEVLRGAEGQVNYPHKACMGKVVGLVRHGLRGAGECLRPQQKLALHNARYDLGRLLVCAHLLEGCQEAAWKSTDYYSQPHGYSNKRDEATPLH